MHVRVSPLVFLLDYKIMVVNGKLPYVSEMKNCFNLSKGTIHCLFSILGTLWAPLATVLKDCRLTAHFPAHIPRSSVHFRAPHPGLPRCAPLMLDSYGATFLCPLSLCSGVVKYLPIILFWGRFSDNSGP